MFSTILCTNREASLRGVALKNAVYLIRTDGSHCAKVNQSENPHLCVDSLVTAVNADILNTNNTNEKNPESEMLLTPMKFVAAKTADGLCSGSIRLFFLVQDYV